MTMRDRAVALSAKSFGLYAVDQVADWCRRNPPGRVYVGDWHTGQVAETHGVSDAERLAFAWALRARCWSEGWPCLIGWGFRPDVIAPPNTARVWRAYGLVPEFVAESQLGVAAAFGAWDDDWQLALKGNLDARWWSDVLAKRERAVAYCAIASASTVEIVGALADVTSAAWRDWVIGHAADVALELKPDWWMVGVKPWERAGSDYMTPSTLVGVGSLIQPPPFSAGAWAHGISDLLVRLAEIAPVVTMTRPELPPEKLMIGGTAAESVVGEWEPGVLA